jgi:hypothetical protein
VASAEASAKSSYMAPASVAPASSMAAASSTAASSMAAASSTAASSMAAAATSGKEFSWSQDQQRACERDCNSTVHGYLHMKGGRFRAN